MDEARNQVNITISTGTVWRALGVVLLLILLYLLRDLLLIIMTSVVIASAVEPATKWLGRYKFPRVLAVLAVYVIFFAVFLSVLYFFIPPLFTELSGFSSNFPEQIETLGSDSLSSLSSATGGLTKNLSAGDLLAGLRQTFQSFAGNIIYASSALFGGALSFVLILVISFYLAVQERGIENFLRLVTPFRAESYVLDLWRRSQYKIGKWMQGQIVLGLIVGLLVFLGLMLLQVKFALALALIAAIFEIIPVFGPILSAVPGVLLGFSENVTLGLLVLGLYIIIQQFENHLIYPLVVKKVIGLPPLIVIIALIIGAKLAGFLGIILSVPVATIVMEVLSDYQKRKLVFQQHSNAN